MNRRFAATGSGFIDCNTPLFSQVPLNEDGQFERTEQVVRVVIEELISWLREYAIKIYGTPTTDEFEEKFISNNTNLIADITDPLSPRMNMTIRDLRLIVRSSVHIRMRAACVRALELDQAGAEAVAS